MKIRKSSRHSRITGDFGESLILYWLSKSGFECAVVDHTGIDIIARHPHRRELLGISVKSRSRNEGTEGTHLNVRKPDIDKARLACETFLCKPYLAFVVDEAQKIRVFMLSIADFLKIKPGGTKVSAWTMSESSIRRYQHDKRIWWFELGLGREGRWLEGPSSKAPF